MSRPSRCLGLAMTLALASAAVAFAPVSAQDASPVPAASGEAVLFIGTLSFPGDLQSTTEGYDCVGFLQTPFVGIGEGYQVIIKDAVSGTELSRAAIVENENSGINVAPPDPVDGTPRFLCIYDWMAEVPTASGYVIEAQTPAFAPVGPLSYQDLEHLGFHVSLVPRA